MDEETKTLPFRLDGRTPQVCSKQEHGDKEWGRGTSEFAVIA